MPPRFLIVLVLTGLAMINKSSDAAEPIRYTLRFPGPQTHYVEVEAIVPTAGKPDIELMMPIWTPGSYLVREYARNVEGLGARAVDGPPLEVEKVRKNRWKVATTGSSHVRLEYRVYGREMSVQANWIDRSFALLNGAATFLTLAGSEPRPHEVTLVLPSGWSQSITGLPETPGGRPHSYVAADYDTLVDSPIYAGNPAVYTFEVDGKRHVLVNEGEGGIWDGARSARDVEAIVRAERDFWGVLPYDRYVFFNILAEATGGLEHKNSTVLMASRWATRTRKDYLGWLGLVSHEFFHTWNVKRLRPVELGPFDYENEVTTRSLWIAEGVTSYFDRLLVRRAGLSSVDEYLEGDQPPPGADSDKPKNDIEKLQETPGRLVQPLESASYDAWIKHYRRDENTLNTAISYYTKGAVVGFLLDARVRRATGGSKSLDDVLRLAYDRYSGTKGFTPDEFRSLASEVAGTDLTGWFHKALDTTEELDYTEALDWFGLRFAKADPGKEKKPEKAWLGLVTKPENGRLMVTQVKRETPGLDAGFNVGDEIVAIGDERVLPDQWSKRMEQYRSGETVSILLSRRGRLLRLDATFGREPASTWKLELNPEASADQKARRKAWLGEKS
jgi:predicted metalloprotease with PDZ domain